MTWQFYYLRIARILNINTMNEQDIKLTKLQFANHDKRLAINPQAMEDK